MAKDQIADWDPTADSNTDIGGISTSGTAPVSNFDNAFRELMAQVADWAGADTLASGTTTDLGSVPGMYVTVSGTATITSFGTIKAGTVKFVYFSGAGAITHNATTLILPGAVSITRAAGDTAIFVSQGSGNWRCVTYSPTTERVGDVLVASGTLNALSTSGTILLPSKFRAFRLLLTNLNYTDGANPLFLQVSENSGSSYFSGGTDYLEQTNIAAGTSASLTNGSTSYATLIPANSSNSTQRATVTAYIDPGEASSSLAGVITNSVWINAVGAIRLGSIGTKRTGTGRINAIVFAPTSGTFATGYYSLHGLL